jgi:hypothetical protein
MSKELVALTKPTSRGKNEAIRKIRTRNDRCGGDYIHDGL